MRWDRDAHMKILFDNLQPGLGARNFGEKSLDTHVTFSTPFDWSSIMMYGPDAYGKEDKVTGKYMTTIEPLMTGVEFSGPETKMELSLIDKVELGRAYSDVADEYCFNDDTLQLYA